MEICVHSGLPIAMVPCLEKSLHQKEAIRMELKNVNPQSVQKAYKHVRAGKLPGYLHRRVRPTIEI